MNILTHSLEYILNLMCYTALFYSQKLPNYMIFSFVTLKKLFSIYLEKKLEQKLDTIR